MQRRPSTVRVHVALLTLAILFGVLLHVCLVCSGSTPTGTVISLATAFSISTTPSARARARATTAIATKSTATQLALFNFFGNNSNQNKEKQAQSTQAEDGEAPYYEKDSIEKVFEFFFGKPEAEPLGLKRFGKDRFPEQYPATVDEWAAPVVGDTSEMARFRPLLKNTNLETRKLRLTFDANRDGWDAIAFHRAVDRLGGALVVCTTLLGVTAGGYNPKGWVGYGENRGSIAAFLFKQNIDGSFTKLRKVGGAGMAQMDNPENGPCFGADSLVIPLNTKSNPRMARSKLGSYYERFPDGTNSIFGKNSPTVQLRDLKVFHGVYEEGEYVPFTDAEPFALY